MLIGLYETIEGQQQTTRLDIRTFQTEIPNCWLWAFFWLSSSVKEWYIYESIEVKTTGQSRANEVQSSFDFADFDKNFQGENVREMDVSFQQRSLDIWNGSPDRDVTTASIFR